MEENRDGGLKRNMYREPQPFYIVNADGGQEKAQKRRESPPPRGDGKDRFDSRPGAAMPAAAHPPSEATALDLEAELAAHEKDQKRGEAPARTFASGEDVGQTEMEAPAHGRLPSHDAREGGRADFEIVPLGAVVPPGGEPPGGTPPPAPAMVAPLATALSQMLAALL